ncbi:MAG: hypothetical protein M1457_11185 [bacterium]|nr:hypothetical protein [bacterium]
MSNEHNGSPSRGCGRREFLQAAVAIPAAMIGAQAVIGASAPAPAKMPLIRIGRHSISRLVCGSNPFNGGSHLSGFVNREMREYFTPEKILETLRHCEELGVNTWQSGNKNLDLYRRHVKETGKMHFLSIESNDPNVIGELAQAGCIGIAHHGEVTDQLFKQGKLDQVNDYLKRIRDAGLLVGVSTHMPDVVDAIESKGWDLDYYMTCVYQRHRTEAELRELLGHVPLPVGEVYLKSDPPRMFKAMRQTRRPCLAFKILAAGRLSDRPEWVEAAFRETFAAIKPGDGVILGIYDRYSDQVAEDTAYVRRFS